MAHDSTIADICSPCPTPGQIIQPYKAQGTPVGVAVPAVSHPRELCPGVEPDRGSGGWSARPAPPPSGSAHGSAPLSPPPPPSRDSDSSTSRSWFCSQSRSCRRRCALTGCAPAAPPAPVKPRPPGPSRDSGTPRLCQCCPTGSRESKPGSERRPPSRAERDHPRKNGTIPD